MEKVWLIIETEINRDGEFELYGKHGTICPEHRDNVKECFLDELICILEYGTKDDKDIGGDAVRLKKEVLDSIKIRRRDKDVRIMSILEDVNGRCSKCTLLTGCTSLKKQDSKHALDPMNCPLSLIVIGDQLYRSAKPRDFRPDLP